MLDSSEVSSPSRSRLRTIRSLLFLPIVGLMLSVVTRTSLAASSSSSAGSGSTTANTTTVLDLRFEEARWVDTNDEVRDSSGNGRHGRARNGATTASTSPALAGSPGTCRYGTFSGNRQGIELPAMKSYAATTALTYALWMNPSSRSGTRHIMGPLVPSGSSPSQLQIYFSNGNLVARAATAAGVVTVSTTGPTLNAWSHVAVVFSSQRLVLYVDAQAVASASFAATTLIAPQQDFMLSNRDSNADSFSGSLDEVRVYGSALDASGIASLRRETRACAGAASVAFRVIHDRQAVWCQAETISVRVLDASGNLASSHAGSIVLDTQTSTGTWSLVRGAGSFSDGVANDGSATYRFSANDAGQASFALTVSSGSSSIDVDVYDTSARDDDSEGRLAFGPSGLILTAHAVANPPPASIVDPLTRTTAGTPFELHLAAGAGSGCSVSSGYSGAQSIRFWVQYADPSSGSVLPTVDSRVIAASEAAAVAQTVTFQAGRGVVSVKYKDAGRIVLWAADASASSTVRGSTGSFVSAPADLSIASVTRADGSANPGVADPDGALFARAGEPFRVTVVAVDAEGDPTPGFGREATPEGIRLSSSVLVAPTGGRNGSSGDGSLTAAAEASLDPTSPGRFTNTAVAFDEVGAIRLRATVADGDYLGAGAVVGGDSGVVGRFAPSHFTVTANSPRFATACAVGAFTWLDQPFGFAAGQAPELVVTAVDRAGGTTRNYAGSWFRLTNASLAGRRYSSGDGLATAAGSGSIAVAVDESGLPPTTIDPVIDSHGDGSATLRFSTGSGLALVRAAPRAPFDAELELSLDVLDADATAYPDNPVRIGGTTPGTGIAFDVSKRFQWGRLRLDNAYGSELVALSMRLRAQRFDGRAFADDDNDSCSRVPATAIVAVSSPTDLVAPPSVANVPLLVGDAGLALGAPRAPGTVDLRVDLGGTGANLPWLRGDWPDDGNLDGVYDDDPRGRATFGIWEGRDVVIFQRELY